MVRALKYITFGLLVILSILSSFGEHLSIFKYLDVGIFNYSVLFVITLVVPNYNYIMKQLHSSELEVIKLPFCEFKLLKKYDYFFFRQSFRGWH